MSDSDKLQLSFWELDSSTEPTPKPAQLEPVFPEPEELIPQPAALSELSLLFARVFERMDLRRPSPIFEASFHPFAGLRSTVRLRHGRALVRISDVLEDASPLVLEAVAELLLSQVYRARPSREARDCYRAYIMKPEVRASIEEVRRIRGFKMLLPPKGRYFDLCAVFDELNAQFFKGKIEARIGWSPNRSRTLLGHYDSAHGTITISRWFDSPSVPRYVVDYLVYHEMLHVLFPVERNGDRRVVHSAEFRRAERKFPAYEQAHKRLKRMSGHLENM